MERMTESHKNIKNKEMSIRSKFGPRKSRGRSCKYVCLKGICTLVSLTPLREKIELMGIHLDSIFFPPQLRIGNIGYGHSWWWTGKPGMLQSMGSQRVGHDWVTELNWTYDKRFQVCCKEFHTGHGHAQREIFQLSFFRDKMRSAAWDTTPKGAVGEGQYRRFWWKGSSMQPSTHFTKSFLLVVRSWRHHEEI